MPIRYGRRPRRRPCPSRLEVGDGGLDLFDERQHTHVFALSACAAIATRGSVSAAVPLDPTTVEITSGPAANTTGIQVRQLLFFGGNLASEAFHAAMIC
jgi:hypothetical protein